MRHSTKAIAIALLATVVCYFGAYLALVSGAPPLFINGSRVPYYSVGGAAAERFFYPAHVVDRNIRKRYWSWTL